MLADCRTTATELLSLTDLLLQHRERLEGITKEATDSHHLHPRRMTMANTSGAHNCSTRKPVSMEGLRHYTPVTGRGPSIAPKSGAKVCRGRVAGGVSIKSMILSMARKVRCWYSVPDKRAKSNSGRLSLAHQVQ